MLDFLVDVVFNIGYVGFFFYMVVVGTFIPLPTQLILLPAGYLVSQGRLDFFVVLIVTALGITIGALINYHLAKTLSKRVFDKSKVVKVERFFKKYGKLSLFLAPLSFGLGQYISIPAGVAKIELKWFIPIIFISNTIWNSTMLILGYMYGEDASSHTIYIVGGGVIFLIAVVSIFVYRELR